MRAKTKMPLTRLTLKQVWKLQLQEYTLMEMLLLMIDEALKAPKTRTKPKTITAYRSP